MNALTQQVQHADVREAFGMLRASAGVDIVRTTSGVWSRGQDVFDDIPRLSFVGALLVASARERGSPYLYAFDSGFDGIDGIRRLNTNADPDGP